MKHTSRRTFLKTLGLAAVGTATAPAILKAANSKARVVVIGGGFAGATAAKYLKHWSPELDVTLVESNSQYRSPIMSNLVINGQMNLSQISFDYAILRDKYCINVINDVALGIDPANKTVELAQQTLAYDRLIIAPGISFLPVDGHDFSKVPHAWKSGDQLALLKQQLDSMNAGDDFVLSIPKAPYRCPPGPYERACIVADYLKSRKPGSKVIVLDANADILAEKEAFSHAFNVSYAGLVEYHPSTTVEAVDADRRIAITNKGEYDAGVLNVIPEQAAGKIIQASGLANDSSARWSLVDPISYESQTHPGIHIIGDSQATAQPKAGHIANAEAKVCADAVIRLINGTQPYATPTTNSACYSPVSTQTASWATVVYRYHAATASMQAVPGSSAAASRADSRSYREMFHWARNLFSDTFS